MLCVYIHAIYVGFDLAWFEGYRIEAAPFNLV